MPVPVPVPVVLPVPPVVPVLPEPLTPPEVLPLRPLPVVPLVVPVLPVPPVVPLVVPPVVPAVVPLDELLDVLPPPKAKPTRIKPKLVLPEFQPVTRDFAFIVNRAVAAGDIVKAAQAAERVLISDVGVFDLYEGAGIPEGQKSVAIAVTLQPKDRTLAEADLDAVSRKIVDAVTRKVGATLRSDPSGTATIVKVSPEAG